MSFTIQTVQCPACGAATVLEEGKSDCTCSYCGSTFLVANENEYIHRHVDEAKLRQVEMEREKWLYQVEQEALRRKQEEEKKEKDQHQKTIFIRIIAGCIILGLVSGVTELCTIGTMIGLGYWAYRYFKNQSEQKQLAIEMERLRYTTMNRMPQRTMPPTPPVFNPALKTCPHCGIGIKEGIRFCPNCGKEVEPSKQSKTKSSNVETAARTVKTISDSYLAATVIRAGLNTMMRNTGHKKRRR